MNVLSASVAPGRRTVPCAVLALLLCQGSTSFAGPQAFVQPPARVTEFPSYERHAAYVPLADGTRLAVTWYLPAGGPSVARFPVLLWYMPGHRESVDPRTGVIRPGMDAGELAYFTGRGYVVAVAEMRGSGASTGFRVIDRGPQIGKDGRELVDWMERQPWCSGKIGMIGVSFQGFTQFATAAEHPPALKAIFPEIAGFDDYTSLYFPGGILNVAIARVAYAAMGRDDRNEFIPDGRPPNLPSVPVVDEDGDGELADEIPVYPPGKTSFLDAPPTWADGRPREQLYWQATRAHQNNGILTNEVITKSRHRDSTLGSTPLRYRDLDPGTKPLRIAQAGIAVYNRGGWFDYHARDTTQWFGTLQGHTPTRLLMAPTGHSALPPASASGPGHGNAYLRHFHDDATTNALVLNEKLRFFDRYLRDEHNGFDAEPPVLIYVMGKGWRRETEWPLKRARPLRLSLAAPGKLDLNPGDAAVDEWQVDTEANSLSQGANRWNYGIGSAAAPMSLDASLAHRLAYTSAPLESDREITGHPTVELMLGSNTDSADVYAYLEDVAPDGSSLLVSEGQLRANYHRLKPAQDMLPAAKPKVRPALPWHGYTRADYDPAPFAGGRALRLVFDLTPTAWLFQKGHSIRLSLAGADKDSFEPSLSQAPQRWRVHRGAGLSALDLPWIP